MVRGEEGIYLLCGNEDFLKDEASKKIIFESLPGPPANAERYVYNAKEDHAAIFETLGSPPLLSDTKIVVIKDIENLPEHRKKDFLAYLEKLPRHTKLIVFSSQDPESSKFIKAISSLARTDIFKKPRPRELEGWIQKRLGRHKMAITKGALAMFLELKGNENLSAIAGELDKIITYKGGEKTVNQDDVANLVGRSPGKRIYELMEAISRNDAGRALFLAQGLFEKKNSVAEAIGLMGWQIRKIWKAKLLLNGKGGVPNAKSRLNMSAFSADKLLAQAGRFSVEKLRRDSRLLVEADSRIKSANIKPRLVMEELIIRLCGG